MGKDKKPKCECDSAKTRGYSRYYDTPDGCNIKTKILVATRYGVLTGLVMSTYDVLMYSHAVGFTKIMGRYMLHTVPLALMGATFAAVANASQLVRMKDDELNYFIGGLACGPIVGSYMGTMHATVLGGLFLGLAGVVKKTGVMQGWTFLPIPPASMGTCRSWRNDSSLAYDPTKEINRVCKDEDFE